MKQTGLAHPARRKMLQGLGIIALGAGAGPAGPAAANFINLPKASYRVELLSVKPLRFAVTAIVQAAATLDMVQSYPAELPQMAKGGWPVLISGLKVTDFEHRPIEAIPLGAKGWRLVSPPATDLQLRYTVDLSLFEAAGWSSPLESAIADEDQAVVCGRALFITTGADSEGPVEVEFVTPPPWKAYAPWWPPGRPSPQPWRVLDLTDNMIVFSRTPPDVVRAGAFNLQITAMGHWAPLRPLVRKALQTIISREVALMGYQMPEVYNVVLIPTVDQGGEAYRQSFAYCFAEPTAANIDQWANTLAHEIFHYWNYARLRGADYASTQWFQEGFTEYAANLTLVTGGITTPEQFLVKLSQHVANARKLTTTLENIGTHKGPPLYSAGALTAFFWDVMLHRLSGGRRGIGDFFRNLWAQTGRGARPYAWPDIKAALAATAAEDWEVYYRSYIQGDLPLPFAEVLPMAGLRLVRSDGGAEVIERDPAAPPVARTLWEALVSGR